MGKSTITGSSKKRRGRPTLYEGSKGKGAPQIGLRLPPPELAAIDRWIAKQPKPKPSRPVAIRRLVGLALETKAKPAPRIRAALVADLAAEAIDSLVPKVKAKSKQRPAARAKELAAKAIDKMSDPSAPPEERAQRRRRLTKGPTEFREARIDQPKTEVDPGPGTMDRRS